MKRITILPLILLVLLCWLPPVQASNLIPIYSLLLSAKKAGNKDYRYVEICQVGENGSDISSAIVEWNLVLTQPDGGDIYWVFNDTEYKSYRFLNNDFGELGGVFGDFAYINAFDENASWQTYDYNSVRVLESDEYDSVVDFLLSYERTDDTSKTLRTNEVLNFYHKELWTRMDVREIQHNHLQNQSCVRDEPEEIVGCEYMWQATLSYTIDGYNNDPNDPNDQYHYSGEVSFAHVVLAYDTFSKGNAGKSQCWYPNEEGRTNTGGYVVLNNSINRPESKKFIESCVGGGCAALSREQTAEIRLDIENEKLWVSPGVEADINLDTIMFKHGFSKDLENEHPSAADDVIKATISFTPKAIHYSRPIVYCGYNETSWVYDFAGECNTDNPAAVWVPEGFL